MTRRREVEAECVLLVTLSSLAINISIFLPRRLWSPAIVEELLELGALYGEGSLLLMLVVESCLLEQSDVIEFVRRRIMVETKSLS